MNKIIIEEIARVSKAEKWPYPKTYKALKEMGVLSYEVKTSNHQIVYSNGDQSLEEPIPEEFQALKVADIFSKSLLKTAIENSQSGKINYEQFLKAIADAGVQSYRVEMAANVIIYYGAKPDEAYLEKIPYPMSLQVAAEHCDKAWSAYAQKHDIRRNDEFYLFKMQEELGELVRTFLEMRGNEYKTKSEADLRKKFEGDCASVVGNALILARHFKVDIERKLLEKFPVD